MRLGSRQSAFLISLALAVAAFGPARAEAADGGGALHTITVSGIGEVKAVPDEAVLSAGVVSQGATAGDALAANRRAMSTVFTTLKRQGIPDKSIRTSGFNISPQYETGPRERPVHVVGYQVSNDVWITLDDVSKLGVGIDALVAAGANSMDGISFTVHDPVPLQRQAREAAVKDALEKAQTYAQAAGVSLGPVLQIEEKGAPSPHPVFANSVMGFEASAATPIAAGEQTLTAQVTVTFEIK